MAQQIRKTCLPKVFKMTTSLTGSHPEPQLTKPIMLNLDFPSQMARHASSELARKCASFSISDTVLADLVSLLPNFIHTKHVPRLLYIPLTLN